MKHLKSVLAVFLASVLLFTACMTASASEKDVPPTGMIVEAAEDGVTTVVTYDTGDTITVDGVIDVEATEKNAVIQRIGKIQVQYENEPVLTVEPRDIAATGSSEALGNGYYAISFPIPETTRECYLAGLLPDKVDHIQTLLLESYTDNQWFSIEDVDFIDAEKLADVSGDDLMCWAGAASNMLHYSGWGKQAGFATEDDIFEAFIDAFEDDGYDSADGINWFFDKNAGQQLSKPGSGGYLPQYDLTPLLQSKPIELRGSDSDSLKMVGMEEMFGCLREGDAVEFDVRWVYGDDAHALTLWGYITDSSFAPTDPDHYCSLILSDSDNNQPSGTDRRVAPNTMDLYRCYVLQDDDRPTLCIDYKGSPGELLGYSALKPYSEGIPCETDERASLDKINDPDFYVKTINVSSYPEKTTASPDKVYAGDVYLFAEIKNVAAAPPDEPLTVAAVVKDADGNTVFTGESQAVFAPEAGSLFTYCFDKIEQLSEGTYTADVTVNPNASIKEALLFNNHLSSTFEITGQKPDTSSISVGISQGDFADGYLELFLDYGDLENTDLYQNSEDVMLLCSRFYDGQWRDFLPVCSLSSDGALDRETMVTGSVQKVKFALHFYQDGRITEYMTDDIKLMLPDIEIVPAQPFPDEPLTLNSAMTGLAEGRQILFTLKNHAGEWMSAVDGTYEVYARSADTDNIITLIPPVAVTLQSGEESDPIGISPWGGGTDFRGKYYIIAKYTYTGYDNYSLIKSLCAIGVPEKGSSIVDDESDEVDPLDNKTTLREAVSYVEENGGTVTFAPGVRNITLNEPIEIHNSVRLDGTTSLPGGSSCIAQISADRQSRIFTVAENGVLDLGCVALVNCKDDTEGGAVLCDGGTLLMDHVFINNASSTDRGGALCFNGGSGVIRNSGFAGMSSADGAAIYLDHADAEILNTMINDIIIDGNGAVYNHGGRLNLINSAVVDGRADDNSRSIDIVYSDGETNIVNSILTDTYNDFRSAAGSVSVYGSALYDAADEVVTDEMTKRYENSELFCTTWLGLYPDVRYDFVRGSCSPSLTERALEGCFVRVKDGELYLSKDNDSFTATGVKTTFADEELTVDMTGRQRRAVFGPYSMLSEEYILGDADSDNTVNITDVTMIQRFIAHMLVYYDSQELAHADVDRDGDLTIIDATWIQRFLVNMKVKYPIGEIVKTEP